MMLSPRTSRTRNAPGPASSSSRPAQTHSRQKIRSFSPASTLSERYHVEASAASMPATTRGRPEALTRAPPNPPAPRAGPQRAPRAGPAALRPSTPTSPGGRHVGDALPRPRQVLGEDAPHVVVVEVVDGDRSFDPRALGDVVGREDAGALEPARRDLERRVQEACPTRARGDDHVGVAELQDLLGAEAIAAIDADVRQPLELGAAPVEDAAPGGEPREARLEEQPPADHIRRLPHAHLVAPPAERQRALEARGTCADPEDRAGAPRLGDALGTPAAAPLV